MGLYQRVEEQTGLHVRLSFFCKLKAHIFFSLKSFYIQETPFFSHSVDRFEIPFLSLTVHDTFIFFLFIFVFDMKRAISHQISGLPTSGVAV